MYEITSSGLSHYYPVGFLYDYVLPNKYSYLPTVTDYNFGKVSIDWGNSKEKSIVSIELIDGDNNTRAKVPLKYSDLSYNENYKENLKCSDYVNSRFRNPKDFFNIYAENKRKLFDLIPFFGFYLFVLLLLFIIFYPLFRITKLIFICLNLLFSFIFKSKKGKIE